MVFTPSYGDASWSVTITENIPTGGAEGAISRPAAGDGIYLLIPEIRYGCTFNTGAKAIPAGKTYSIKTGKRHQYVAVSQAKIIGVTGATMDTKQEAINRVTEFIMEHHESGENPVYICCIRNGTAQSFYEEETKRWWLRGFFTDFEVIESSNSDALLRFRFLEAWS